MLHTNSLSYRALRYFPRLPLHEVPRSVLPIWCDVRDTPWLRTMHRQVATATLVARLRPRVALSSLGELLADGKRASAACRPLVNLALLIHGFTIGCAGAACSVLKFSVSRWFVVCGVASAHVAGC